MKRCPIAVIILTLNEEICLPYALNSVVQWAAQVFVVDSFSTDRTVEIAKSYGAEVHQNAFVSFTNQRNWALNNLPIRTEWVFFLDADEYLSEKIKQEIVAMLELVPDDVNGFITKVKFMYLGQWLRYGDLYQKLIRLVRRDKGSYVVTSGFREKMVVQSKVGKLNSYIVHYDHKGLRDWAMKQMNRIAIDAQERLNNHRGISTMLPSEQSCLGSMEGGKSRRLRERLTRLPGPVCPFAQFFYRYIIRLGFLDGWRGFIYHFLLQFWYPLMVEAMYLELCYRQNLKKKPQMHDDSGV